MHTPTLLTAAFAILAFATEQGTQGEECGECDQYGGGGGGYGGGGRGGGRGRGRGGYSTDDYDNGYDDDYTDDYDDGNSYGNSGGRQGGGGRGRYGGGFTNRRPSRYGGGGGGGGGGRYNFNDPCQDGETDDWDGYPMRCQGQQWQYQINGQWQIYSSTSNNYAYQQSDGHGNRQSTTFSSNTNTQSGGYFQGTLSASNQIPLHFDNSQYDIPLNRLYPYDTTCSQIDFPDEDPCQECGWDVKKVTCQAYSDPEGNTPIGNQFGYGSSCSFGQPTKVFALLCTVS